jgi:hypothetical protein
MLGLTENHILFDPTLENITEVKASANTCGVRISFEFI